MLELDDAVLAKEERIRLKAMLERDKRENSGFGDQLMEMQQTSLAIDKIHRGLFKIDMCFSCGDDGGDVLQWCQGTVAVLKEENNHVTVRIKWDRECLREGDSETSSRGGTHKIVKNILLHFLIFELGDPKIYMSIR